MFLVHREELIEQTAAKFEAFGIPFGIVAAGYRENLNYPIQIGSVFSVTRRLHRLPNFSLLIPDEAHHGVAQTWGTIFDHYPDASLLGLTATPIRLDGRGLSERFDTMILGLSVREMIARGLLVRPVVYGPKQPLDLKGVRSLGGDYDSKSLTKRMNKPQITGDAVEQYCRHGRDGQALVYCVSIEHAQSVARAFEAAGYPAASIDGEMPKGDRWRQVQMFRAGALRVLTNCNLVVEGFDVPGVHVVIDLGPTKSLQKYLQKAGRGMRVEEGKTHCVYLDHAANYLTHGFPDEDREWTLDGIVRRPGDGAPPVRQCEECFAVAPASAAVCPCCGAEFPTRPIVIKATAGELEELSKMPAVPDTPLNRWLQTMPYQAVLKWARTREQLQQVANARGYGKGWVQKQEQLRHSYRQRFRHANAR